MNKINILPKHLAELIAAGEVVERPSSVVKETLENSIDAGAKNISVEIQNGGISFIRITDDGSGIRREDVENAFRSHATSKISTEDDLNSIFTLGFRGEALASIAAVSKVELLTKTEKEEVGTRFVIEGGEKVLLDDAGCPKGSTLIVRDLFYNVPARMKFLKRDITEANYVSAVVDKIALSNPGVSIRYIKNGKQELLTPGDSNLYNTIFSVFGKEFAQGLIKVKHENESFKIHGFISDPKNSRPNRNMQHFFLNGRQIKSPTASAALSEAYKNSIMSGKFPACVLNIEIDPGLVDVNVHPTKTEVRFADEKPLFSAVYYSAKGALTGTSLNATVSTGEEKSQAAPPSEPTAQPTPTLSTSADYLKQEETKPFLRQGIGHQSQNTALHRSLDILADDLDEIEKSSSLGSNKNEDDLSQQSRSLKEEEAEPAASKMLFSDTEAKTSQEAFVDYQTEKLQKKDEINLIGEIFATYLLAQVGRKIIIIDKHAAHERIIFNNLLNSTKNESRQILLTPLPVLLSKEEYAAVIENIKLLSEANFLAEDFGSGSVLVRECPMELTQDDISEVIIELADYLLANKTELLSSKREWLLESIACRAAIKAGDFTSEYEAKRFVEMLMENPQVKFCPHGRPVYIEVEQGELEKLFGRS
ncbi:MAG: DNA mismatch repair endonuclease MutL [Clostridiales bacterium]|nr:DNA mismatch repair endonuclease MutL [Clostridiales bacterium]